MARARLQIATRRPDWFLIGLVLATALAWLFPDPGAKGGSLRPELVNRLGVSLIFFLHGLTLSFAALKAGVRNVRLHALVQLCTFLFFPLLGLLLLALVGGEVARELRIGLFYLCVLPSTVSSSVALTAAAGGNVPAALFNATLSSLLGVFLTPLWLSVALGASGESLALGPVVMDLVLWLVLPLFLGQALRPSFGAFAERHHARLAVLDRVTILLLVYTSFCDSFKAGVWSSGIQALWVSLLASLALLGLVMSVVWRLSGSLGFERGDRIVALFCGSKKTLASGVPMARLIFGAEAGLGLILLPILLYHPLQLVVGSWLARRLAQSNR